ncbi:hypothetical protein B0H14DRAFT_2386123, partial [Mycena olivaceomarginata]
IDLGNQGSNNIAWVSGQSACNNVVTGPNGPSPCGRVFGFSDQSGFTIEGCGGDLLINQNGAFYAQCDFNPGSTDCGVTRGWHCV